MQPGPRNQPDGALALLDTTMGEANLEAGTPQAAIGSSAGGGCGVNSPAVGSLG